jgi:hypothetical protein
VDEWDGRGWSWDLCRDDAKRLSARKEMLRAMLLSNDAEQQFLDEIIIFLSEGRFINCTIATIDLLLYI